MGITFTVYSDGENIDRAWPFDVVPRLISGAEWEAGRTRSGAAPARAEHVHRRHLQRSQDHRRRSVPGRLARRLGRTTAPSVRASRRSSACGRTSRAPTSSAAATATSTCSKTTCGCPLVSATSSRTVVSPKRTFPELFERQRVRPVDGYTDELNKLLNSLAPDGVADPMIVVLDAGHLQLGLLRAFVPRPTHGCRVGRGCRSQSSATTTAST